PGQRCGPGAAGRPYGCPRKNRCESVACCRADGTYPAGTQGCSMPRRCLRRRHKGEIRGPKSEGRNNTEIRNPRAEANPKGNLGLRSSEFEASRHHLTDLYGIEAFQKPACVIPVEF